MVELGIVSGAKTMSFLSDEKTRLLDKVHELSESLEKARDSIGKELADSMAGADRDFGYFRQDDDYDEKELQNISERMQMRATQFESEHPKLSAVFREFSELLRSMGV